MAATAMELKGEKDHQVAPMAFENSIKIDFQLNELLKQKVTPPDEPFLGSIFQSILLLLL